MPTGLRSSSASIPPRAGGEAGLLQIAISLAAAAAAFALYAAAAAQRVPPGAIGQADTMTNIRVEGAGFDVTLLLLAAGILAAAFAILQLIRGRPQRQEGGMKKLVLVAAALFLLSLAACSDSAAPVPSDGDAQTGIVMLDAGVWPENDYTAGLPVPPGRVAWAMLDPGHESCSISLTDLTENDYRSYRKQLEQAGFTVLEETSEEVRGQAYVSIGTLLSGETVNLSMSYIPGSLTLYLRPPV